MLGILAMAITDVVGGQVKVAILGLAPVLRFIKSGQLKANSRSSCWTIWPSGRRRSN